MALEQASLLNTHEAGVDDDWVDLHNENKTDSNTSNRSLICFIIAVFTISVGIGTLIGYEFDTSNTTSHVGIDDLTILKQPNISNILPQHPHMDEKPPNTVNTPKLTIKKNEKPPITPITPITPKPTIKKNEKPASPPSTATKPNKISDSLDDEIFIAKQHEVTNLDESEAKKLSIDVTRMVVNEKGFSTVKNGPYYGTYSFNYKYPMEDEQQYQTNEIRKNCFHIKLEEGKINYVIIEIAFVKFKLENGFDRILIRSFNDSMVDLPVSMSGNILDVPSRTYLLEQKASQSLCIEFQSDESFVDEGYEYNLNIYYDLCQWTPYDQCYMENLVGVKWRERGPMGNGKCGVGIMSKHRANTSTLTGETDLSLSSLSGEAVLKCLDTHILQTYGPEYCIKRKCVDFDNENDPDWPPIKMPGHAWFKPIEYYNGRGRLDPIYGDPFRIYRSDKNNLMNEKNKVDLIKLDEKLTSVAAQIASEHYDENVLKMAIGDGTHRDTHAEYVGARVLNSLINGRPLTLAAVGDSVTSGHDNMFMNTYPMQVQARLRRLFVESGNKGAAFIARNIAEGGGPNSDSQAFVARSMATETFPYLWGKLNDIIDTKDKYDSWYKYGGLPIRRFDIFIWENYFVSTSDKGAIELDIRQVAAMNSLWGAMVPNRGVKVKDTCRNLTKMLENLPPWTGADKYGARIGSLVTKYLDKMGFVLIYPEYGMRAACEILVNNNVTGGWKGSDDGLPNVCCLPDGQKYSYVGFWMRTNWHPNSRGNRVNADMVSYWILNSAISFLSKYKDTLSSFSTLDEFDTFLTSKSGNWGSQIIQSVQHQKYDEFIEPEYCGKDSKYPYCQSMPFGISNQSPYLYNTHGYLNEYILFKATENIINWKQHIQSVGWSFGEPNVHVLSEKHGMEGPLDSKAQQLSPNDVFYKNKYKQWKTSSNSDDWDEFEKYVISEGYYLQLVVKTPKFGAGRINIFGGHTGWYCDAKNIYNKVIHIYVNSLENIKRNKDDLGMLTHNVTHCTIPDLEADTKYVVSYVPYNMDASLNSFTSMFIAAY